MLILFYVRLSKGEDCLEGLGKRFSQGPAMARIRKEKKIQKKGRGDICTLRAKQVIVPTILTRNKDDYSIKVQL